MHRERKPRRRGRLGAVRAGAIAAVGTVATSIGVAAAGRAISQRWHLAAGDASMGDRRPAAHEMADADPSTRQNVSHSLSTQELLGVAHAYNGWLVDTLREAWAGGDRVLDVGCSIGNVTSVVAERLEQTGSSAVVVGLEIIPDAASRFAERFAGRPDLRVVCGDITQPLPELNELGPFDAAVSFNVVEHIEDDVGALQAVAAHLKPGGRIGLLVPGGGPRLYGTLDALDRHYRRYTPALLRARLEAAGFDVISIRRVNMVGALLWFLKGRVVRSQHFHAGEVKSFDRFVPVLRRLDALCGPPFGQSLAICGRLRAPQKG